MAHTTAPWTSRPALLGAAVGFLAAALLAAAGPGGGLARPAAFAAVIAAGYLAGFAHAASRRLSDAASEVARLRSDLRASQQHIMDHGSSRSLATWVAGAAGPLREQAAGLARDARAIADDATLPEPVRSAAARIAGQAAAIGDTLAPLSGRARELESRAPFDVNTLLREGLVLCRHRAGTRNIRFEQRFAILPPVAGSAQRIHAALLNLLVNAIESMPQVGGTITVETAHEGERVVARVRDTGIGIRPEHIEKATRPFFSTKPGLAAAGLGLWEAKDAIEAIGGTLAIRSVPHQGTEAMVSFPQAAPMSPGRSGTEHPEEVGRNTADEGDRRIA